jgi:hypothetical protein
MKMQQNICAELGAPFGASDSKKSKKMKKKDVSKNSSSDEN